MTDVRRVVTAEADGEAVFARVETVDRIPGSGIFGVWGWEQLPSLPYREGDQYEHRSVFPPVGGIRVNVVEFPSAADPQSVPVPGRNELLDDALTAVPLHRERGPHTRFVATDSIDVVFVIQGQVVVELDGGREQTLRPGDVLIQNGTRHHWKNVSDAPCLIGTVVFNASENPQPETEPDA